MCVFSILPGFSPDIPAQACLRSIPFSRHGFHIIRHASAGYFKQYTTAFSITYPIRRKCTEHSFCRYLRAETVHPYLYIKQLYTPPGVSCCQPPTSCRPPSILFAGRRASILHSSVRLSSPFVLLRKMTLRYAQSIYLPTRLEITSPSTQASLTLGTGFLTKFELRVPLALIKCSMPSPDAVCASDSHRLL